jgi:hypothetical protein
MEGSFDGPTFGLELSPGPLVRCGSISVGGILSIFCSSLRYRNAKISFLQLCLYCTSLNLTRAWLKGRRAKYLFFFFFLTRHCIGFHVSC